MAELQHGLAWLPVAALGSSFALALAVGGPGAVAFPVPALLWCALTYGVFGTAWLTLLFSVWTLASITLGYLSFGGADIQARPVLLSIRLGVSLIALAPLTVSSVMAGRNALLSQLQFLATHDVLSGLLNRGAFHDRGRRTMEALVRGQRPVAVLMLDIDRFKAINDRYGHAAGDRVLAGFAALATGCVREGDMLGRIGGEEFAVVLPDCDRAEAQAVAERIRARFADASLEIGDGRRISATVSIGGSFELRASSGLEELLLRADRALYRAKQTGRNRVEGLALEAGLEA